MSELAAELPSEVASEFTDDRGRMMNRRSFAVGALVVALAACSGGGGGGDNKPKPAGTAADARTAVKAAPDAGAPVKADGGVAANPQTGEGQDFTAEAKLLYRVGACGNDAPVPEPLDQKTVDTHCTALAKLVQDYKDKYLSVAKPYIAALRPADVPKVVVYPFGGGDLLSALTAFPDGTEYTLISLEYSGDPRRLSTLKSKSKLKESLSLLNETMASLLRGDWEWSKNMKKTQRGELPGELAYDLVALAVHGFEPTSLRYFKLNQDGTIHYLSADELKELDGTTAKMLRHDWVSPDYSPAFANMEIRFQPQGGGPERVFRHIAFNLDNDHLTKDPSLVEHLEAKGMVSAMTRAAAFLMWGNEFSMIRDYLTAHLVWMVSDTTGVPPPFAEKAGLEQITYGKFNGAFEPSDQNPRREWNDAFVKLWKKNPEVKLPFRFGYPDINHHAHMMITRRPAGAAASK